MKVMQSLFLAIISVLFLIISPAHTLYSQEWNKLIVDQDNVGWGVRIKLDNNGLPGIAYFNNHSSVKGTVNFAKFNGSTWALEHNIYTSTYNGGGGISLSFNSNSQPRLIFPDYPYNHSYAEKNGSTWNIQTFSCLPDFSGTDLVVDSANNSHIAWYTNSPLQYRRWNGSTWQTQTIDSAGDMGYAPQMVIDNSGHVYIAYGQWANPHILKFAHFDGSTWSTEFVANTDNAGTVHPIVLTSQGYPMILCCDVNGNYNLAMKVNGSWQFQNTPVAHMGGGMGFAIDTNDHIHIVCYQQINVAWYLMYFFYNGTDWTSTAIDQFTAPPVYSGTDVAIGNDGSIHVAYANPDTWSVIYATLSKEQEPLPVPNVVGMTENDAENTITTAGLNVSAWDSEYNACVPIGHIVSQDPSAGTVVDSGSSVTLTTSLGTLPSITCVPYLIGMTYQAARNAILSAGLGIGGVTQSNSATVPSGCVISQGLSAYTSVAKNTSVGLNISLGSVMITVPNVAGMTQAAAQSAITSAGLTAGTITQVYSTTVAAGNVISQSPFASTSVVAGTSVNLTVSMGLPRVTVPNVVGMTYQAARSTILSASLGVGSVTLSKSDTVPSGYVISQGLVAGTSVPKNSPVGLNVSTGK